MKFMSTVSGTGHASAPGLPRPAGRMRRLAWTAWRLALMAIGACGFGLLCVVLPLRAAEPAQVALAPERAVKAAFIYKFLSYAEWPDAAMATPDAPFVIGIIGADAIVPELVRITSGRTVGNRAIRVRPIKDGDPLDGIHLLYIGAAEPAALRRLLKDAQQHAVLTVTDAEGGLNAGSVINFRIVDNRVRFEVAFDTAEKSNLKLSSRLIPVAYSVQKAVQ